MFRALPLNKSQKRIRRNNKKRKYPFQEKTTAEYCAADDELRQQITEATQEFLEKGGKIKIYPPQVVDSEEKYTAIANTKINHLVNKIDQLEYLK